jgi:hypothetical protein
LRWLAGQNMRRDALHEIAVKGLAYAQDSDENLHMLWLVPPIGLPLDDALGLYSGELADDGSIAHVRRVDDRRDWLPFLPGMVFDTYGTLHIVTSSYETGVEHYTCPPIDQCSLPRLIPFARDELKLAIDSRDVLHLLTEGQFDGSGRESGAHYRRLVPGSDWGSSLLIAEESHVDYEMVLDRTEQVYFFADDGRY